MANFQKQRSTSSLLKLWNLFTNAYSYRIGKLFEKKIYHLCFDGRFSHQLPHCCSLSSSSNNTIQLHFSLSYKNTDINHSLLHDGFRCREKIENNDELIGLYNPISKLCCYCRLQYFE